MLYIEQELNVHQLVIDELNNHPILRNHAQPGPVADPQARAAPVPAVEPQPRAASPATTYFDSDGEEELPEQAVPQHPVQARPEVIVIDDDDDQQRQHQLQLLQHQELLQRIECAICTHIWINRRPHVAPCGHILCEDCLNELFERRLNRQLVRCPLCRAVILNKAQCVLIHL